MKDLKFTARQLMYTFMKAGGVTQLRIDGVHCLASASTGPVNLKIVPNECRLAWQVTMDQLICASLSHNHHWYEVGMLKVQFKDSIDVAKNSRSMIFVTIVSWVRWCVCVFVPIYSGASLRLSMYV